MLLNLEIFRARVQLDLRLEVTPVGHEVDGRLEVARAQDGNRYLAEASLAIRLAHDDLHRRRRVSDQAATEVYNAALDRHQVLLVEDVHLMAAEVDLSFISARHFNRLPFR